MPDNANGFLEVPIASPAPADVAISNDGKTLYTAGDDGIVRVYDVATHALLDSWEVGIRLGGMDLAPGGGFLMVTEQEILGFRAEGEYGPYYSTLRAYRVDTATGEVTTYSIERQGGDHVFYDVAVLDDGKVMLTQGAYSAFLPYVTLDPQTGVFTESADSYAIRGALTTSEDSSEALFGPGNISYAPLFVVESGQGVVADHNGNYHYEDGVMGYNVGAQAISLAADLVIQNAVGHLYVYDADLNYQLDLSALRPNLHLEHSVGIAFDASGENLYLLNRASSQIIQLSTADWSLVRTFAVDGVFESYVDGGFGNRLTLTPDSRYFVVVTEAGIRLIGNDSLTNDFNGTASGDDLSAGLGDDRVSGLDGDDTLRGDAGADVLDGGSGNDGLDGGSGADEMRGGAGDDVYWVDNSGDRLVELADEGFNSINSSVTYTLAAGQFVEALILTGAAAINGQGNAFDNRITGNAAANVLAGGAGDDRLDGGLGADTMKGGLGDDVFMVENAGDKVQEGAGEGADTVEAWISYNLANNVETLKLMGSADLTGNGNGLANSLFGNAGDNVLNGGAGADAMAGGAGNDRYIVDNAGDTVAELAGAGNDLVQSSVSFSLAGQAVEALTLIGAAAINGTGNGLANLLIGNGAANVLGGGDGDDALHGGLGADTLIGGKGLDSIWFETKLGAGNVDTITGFKAADDTIVLDRSIFTGIGVDGVLAAGAFRMAAAAIDADDRILYDKVNGDLWYDADGVGGTAAVLFAHVAGSPSMTSADFLVVA